MKKLMLITIIAAATAGVFADENIKGFQLSLAPDLATQSSDTTINGISLGVWNENPGTQWQLGFVNGATGDSAGLQSFVFLPTFYNYAENYTGVQMGFVNWAFDKFKGVQFGALNAAGDLFGLQWGTVNCADNTTTGVQLGLFNYTKTVTDWAFQLGLINIINENDWFTGLPCGLAKGFVFVNWCFK